MSLVDDESYEKSLNATTGTAIYDHAASLVALHALLVAKGIFTEEEFGNAKALAVSTLDQYAAECVERWRRENPEKAKVQDFMEQLFSRKGT